MVLLGGLILSKEEKLRMYQEALKLAGKVATIARSITGGDRIGVGKVNPANVRQMSELVLLLEECLNDYDHFILSMMEIGKDE